MKSERAIRRYLQIASLEKAIRLTEGSIEDVQKEIGDAQDRLSELRRTNRALMKDLRAAARDEGQLPLFGNLELALEQPGTEAVQ